MNSFFPGIGVAFLAIVLTAGCRAAAPPISYYALGALEKPPRIEAPSPSSAVIGIGQITLPEYLDRDQMIVRTSPHRLHIDDSNVWAAPLSDELARILAKNLMMLTGSSQIEHLPWEQRFRPDTVIGMQIFNFEADADGRVHLLAAIRISDRRSNTEKALTVDLEERAAGSSYPELVAAQSRILGELSRRIAAALPKY
jgi:uncharacterized lipoprotein YmbA